jgi:hypothetical protein
VLICTLLLISNLRDILYSDVVFGINFQDEYYIQKYICQYSTQNLGLHSVLEKTYFNIFLYLDFAKHRIFENFWRYFCYNWQCCWQLADKTRSLPNILQCTGEQPTTTKKVLLISNINNENIEKNWHIHYNIIINKYN